MISQFHFTPLQNFSNEDEFVEMLVKIFQEIVNHKEFIHHEEQGDLTLQLSKAHSLNVCQIKNNYIYCITAH